ncbi:Planctomycete cytochrome C [Gimesia aquarii]|uniref:Planctomycete cytochrome C n=2 Tax=Gimesia aquarii TaxID=2527964 RepID=A0A517VXJ4_9PLAN|nr:Planctomycete cytochrome C [Gimesia aquarii]
MRLRSRSIIFLMSLLMTFFIGMSPTTGAEIDFNRDVRPILSDLCFQCHGPDKSQRKAELRLDLKSGLFGTDAESGVIISGKPEESELFSRLITSDPDLQMPPPQSEKQITAAQIATIKQWITSGAPWQNHWAFIPPRRPEVPQVKQSNLVRNPIDAFILDRLEKEGLTPSAEAEKTTLIRRLSLDLTGLPPTLAQQQKFLNDQSSTAYESLVNRLLKSPHYGERMAMEWLDAARYADTSGYQTDGERHMWRWREWVIEAFNSNLPFDQFTVEQLAGDLLPNPTLNQRIATGFNRNHRANSEGGIIFDEYLLEYAVDRVETTGTVWLGLTIGCARCHEHKYDPISQKDFYQLIAFFNNIPERGRVIKYGNAAPFVKAPTQKQQQKLAHYDNEIKQLEEYLRDVEPELRQLQVAWEQDASGEDTIKKVPEKQLAYHVKFEGDLRMQVIGEQNKDFYAKKANAASDTTVVKQEKVSSKPKFAEGIENQALKLHGEQKFSTDKKPTLSDKNPFTIAFWVKPQQKDGTILASLTPAQDESGFRLFLDDGKVKIFMGARWLDDAIRLHSTQALKVNHWSHLAVTYSGNSQARDIKLYLNGVEQDLKIKLNMLTGGFTFPSPLQYGAYHKQDYFRGLIDDLKIFRTNLSSDQVAVLSVTESLNQILKIPNANRTNSQRLKVKNYFLTFFAPEKHRVAISKLNTLKDKRLLFYRSLPTSMVMQERKEPKSTFVLMRGEYDKPGEKVAADIPDSLGVMPEGLPRNRLGLARWLVDPSNPLTARVIVNRYWQMYFGNGLVKTAEDFGSQGDWPTHPGLLDWLATEFIRSGWDVKQLQRLIVTSATYRQSSHISSILKQSDPENRLLARASRLRLPAETIRDQALFSAGLLRKKIGGPSVKPYQPSGVWKEIASQEYQQGTGDDLFRRSMYTYWKRTVPPPAMATFDAPSRETCIVKRSRTNTPLQALALLNDVTYVEAARKLAERMLQQQTQQPEKRIQYAMRLVLARELDGRESKILLKGYNRYLKRFQADPEAAKKFLSLGESRSQKQYNIAEHAAYTVIASLILNLDETINRE